MSSPQPLRLAVFDCDGTLVDSQHSIIASIETACAVIGIAAPSPDQIRRIVGLSPVDGIARLFPGEDAAGHADIARRFREVFAGMRLDDAVEEPLYPGIPDLLDRLAAAGYLLGVATGKSMRGLTATLAR
ncbi:MAG: HAD hydrolase-like protein, partial [Alphaproteobacteria bacterium]